MQLHNDGTPMTAAEESNHRATIVRSFDNVLTLQRARAQAERPASLVAEAHELNQQRAGGDASAAYDEALSVALRDPADDSAWVTTYDVEWGANYDG